MIGGRERDIKGRFTKKLLSDNQECKKLVMPGKEAQIAMMEVGNEYVTLDFSEFNLFIEEAIRYGSNRDNIALEDLIFISNCPVESGWSLTQVANSGMAILDYYQYNRLIAKGLKPKLQIDETLSMNIVSELNKAIFVAYYLLMTRAKLFLSVDEQMPKFCTEYLGFDGDKGKYKKLISNNRMDFFPQLWIRKIKISIQSTAARQRFANGIAGSRYFNIFRDYEWRADADSHLASIATMIRDIAVSGPFFEMHPFFVPESLSGTSLAKNFMNLILEIYDGEVIRKMVENKSLTSIPSLNKKYNQYKTWSMTMKLLYQSRIL